MIDGVVDTEVAVVNTVVLLHVDRLVLSIVLHKVERKLLFDLLGIDSGRNLGLTLVEHRQHGIIYIVIEEDDALLGRADKVRNKGVGIEDLPVEEDSLGGSNIFLVETFENLGNLIVVLCQVRRHLQLVMFNHFQPLKHLCIGGYEVVHSHKSIHYFHTDINGGFAVENRCKHCHSLLGEDVRKRR